MLWFLGRRLSPRKQRLFAVACCRRIWPLLTSHDSREAVEAAERYAEGLARERELASFFHRADLAAQDYEWGYRWEVPSHGVLASLAAANAAASILVWDNSR